MNPPQAELEHPTVTIPGYDVLDILGRGGFSVVYRARQQSMQRDVAVKVLHAGFATEKSRRLFERECHALGRLSHHPNIVTVFNTALTEDGRPSIVMELLPTTYRQRLEAEGPLPADEVMAIGVRIAAALHAAHGAGVLHRDLKPGNMFQSAYGEPALGDFGISSIDEDASQTVMGALSVAYAAPEVVEFGEASPRSDVYSLAASLYQLVTGEPPFKSDTLSTTLRRILSEPPRSIAVVRAPVELDDLLLRALAKDPNDRPASALEFAELIRQIQGRSGFERTSVPRPIGAPAPTSGHRSDAGRPHPFPRPNPLEHAWGIANRCARPDATITQTTVLRARQPPPPPPEPERPRRRWW